MRPARNLWRSLRRRMRRPPSAAPRPAPGPPRVEFSYTVYWTKQVRGWEATRRAAVRAALEAALAQAGFEPNPYQRRYRVAGLDDQAHAGLSLVALRKVLAAFDNNDR